MSKIELLAIQNPDVNGLAVCLKPNVPYVLTPSLAHEIRNLQDVVSERYYKNPWNKPYYIIWHLHTGQIPWKGLDFKFIHQSLINHKDKRLESYLNEIFSLLFINYIGFGVPIINCSIITRPLSGISQDFFYLNHINFIKTKKHTGNTPFNTLYQELSVQQISKNLYFPDKLYSRNEFYGFDFINYTKMKHIVDTRQYVPIAVETQLDIKNIFNEIKENTMSEIYTIASRNIKIFERLAKHQITEHTFYHQNH